MDKAFAAMALNPCDDATPNAGRCRSGGRAGVLVLYTGSPERPDAPAVRAYLKRFLMDPCVLDIPAFPRSMLVHGVIVPLRARRVTEKYRSIWTEAGAPLAAYTHRFCGILSTLLPTCAVASGAAYSRPSVEDALDAVCRAGVDRIIVLPMFPHYAGATRGALLRQLARAAAAHERIPPIREIPPYYHHPGYVRAFSGLAKPLLDAFRPERLVFSYHGLPLRQAARDRARGPAFDYEHQCGDGARILAGALGVAPDDYVIAYQSRMGRGWLGPDLHACLGALFDSGIRRIAVAAPSFVTDCLETLIDLDEEAHALWTSRGGEYLRLPCLNDTAAWAAAAEMIWEEAARPGLL